MALCDRVAVRLWCDAPVPPPGGDCVLTTDPVCGPSPPPPPQPQSLIPALYWHFRNRFHCRSRADMHLVRIIHWRPHTPTWSMGPSPPNSPPGGGGIGGCFAGCEQRASPTGCLRDAGAGSHDGDPSPVTQWGCMTGHSKLILVWSAAASLNVHHSHGGGKVPPPPPPGRPAYAQPLSP